MKLNVKAIALASGILWGGCMTFWGWAAGLLGWGTECVQLFGTFYFGYAPTFLGGIIGGIWGFFDGLIFGLIFAWLYNKLAK
jgi:hypothetical protein